MRAYRVAYDGRPYKGFQRQPAVPTVEDAIFEALCALGVLSRDAEKPEGYAAAGRTDAGVSALAQTIAFEAPDWLTPRALNAELPPEIRAWAAADVPEDFHATHHATARTYTYSLYAPTEPRECDGPDETDPIDDDRFDAPIERLSGTHDFHNLTPDDRNTERTLAIGGTREEPFLTLEIRSDGFPRQLVRRLVSLVQSVGSGEQSIETIDRVLAPTALPGHEGIAPAPAEPLVLTEVVYPDLAFAVDVDAAESARAVFERRRVEHLTRARVAGQIRDGVG